MPFELPPLPHDHAAFEPHLPVDAVEQRRRAQQAHLDAVNLAVDGGALVEATLERLARDARGALAAHAAEAWAAAFEWTCLKPPQPGITAEPEGALAEALARAFGDIAAFRGRFEAAARPLPGPGRVWLAQRKDGRLALVATPASATVLTGQDTPLLACPVAADDGDARARAFAGFWPLVDWKAVAARMS